MTWKSKLFRPMEAIVTAAAAIALAIVFAGLDAFDRLAAFMARHEGWELDELFFVLFFGGVGALVLAIRRARDFGGEIQRREEVEERVFALARHDPLTGAANRRLLQAELPGIIESARAANRQVSVLMIDLDQFKPVNDVLGHDAGDLVLVEVTARLHRVCGADALIARLGGDEFVVVLGDQLGSDPAARMASSIIRALSLPMEINGRRTDVGATIGIARFPVDGGDADELLRVADVAMYEGKRAGKGVYRFFHAEMDGRLRARAELEAGLRTAIESGQIIPFFQPLYSLAKDRIIGFEALARWQHPTRGLIPPDEFIPIAEDIGLIGKLSQRILRDGCIAARDWHPDTTLSVNISPVQLRDAWLAPRILGILAETGFAPQRLIVEVTENAVIDDVSAAAEVFASLQRAGIRVALDDFGKGYSSLSHLRQLRFDHIKIDSSFVRTMDSAESQKIVSAVAGLGRALGMPVTAEGVESEDTARKLRELGCDQAQGYLFGVPGSRSEAAHMLAGNDAERLAAGLRQAV
ncbi:putative bifunctional diguanylate cyclase/phosphodiesterase [Sphingomonas canadensis]|uniref:Bifunctional diguanylate cyclase/phosphodiesterase n=1 Tax=Sphingomonas canadensis TaxID=1219257 RepID=A0ABW3HCX0_9SPHN|nr:EAL domain-containing protein [Sphingomonas canadensis]MCW3837933.1 EAL domain-containing protein [Sphingomonas canadensis]